MSSQPSARVWLDIDLDKLRRNLVRIRERVAPCGVIAVLKADAYGLGVEPIARALAKAGVAGFAVAEPREALRLTGFGLPVQILGGILPDEIPATVAAGVVHPVDSLSTAQRVSEEAVRQNRTVECHFLVDTGMGRLGLLADKALPDIRAACLLPGLNCCGIYSHFPVAYRAGEEYTLSQIARFQRLLDGLADEGTTFSKIHMANSDAINNFPQAFVAPFNLVRTGINLHGSFDSEGFRSLQLEPILSLKSRLVSIRELPADMQMGYGLTYQLPQDTLVGTVAAGYADGPAACPFEPGVRAHPRPGVPDSRAHLHGLRDRLAGQRAGRHHRRRGRLSGRHRPRSHHRGQVGPAERHPPIRNHLLVRCSRRTPLPRRRGDTPMNTHPTTILNNGVEMPMLGLGVWRTPEGEGTESAVACAIEAGYRSIDTAKAYGNETGVGQGLRASGVPREELFVTTKLWNEDSRQGTVREAFEASMARLDLDVLDLYLLHWPVPGKYLDAWKVLEELYAEGRIRAIGVSNFMVHHMEDLLAHAKVVPAVNQIEFHPKLQSPELVAYCRERDIVVEAWSPIMRGQVGDVPEIVRLAETLGKTPVQVTLRWQIQRGIVTIPKSANPERIRANADVFDFELDDAQMETMDGLDEALRMGPDPDNFSF